MRMSTRSAPRSSSAPGTYRGPSRCEAAAIILLAWLVHRVPELSSVSARGGCPPGLCGCLVRPTPAALSDPPMEGDPPLCLGGLSRAALGGHVWKRARSCWFSQTLAACVSVAWALGDRPPGPATSELGSENTCLPLRAQAPCGELRNMIGEYLTTPTRPVQECGCERCLRPSRASGHEVLSACTYARRRF